MDWITENPIGDMYGPAFLVFYALVIVATLCVCKWKIAQSQETGHSFPPVPSRPDPYEMAYLRGGANEVFRLVMFSLFQRGYLEIEGTKNSQTIGPSALRPNTSSLSALEQVVMSEFAAPHKASSLFKSSLAQKVAAYCQGYERQLYQAGLLESEETKATRRQMLLAGFVVIAGLGGYKFFAAMVNGHYNVAFLALMGLVALVILLVICTNQRLSERGKSYLHAMQIAFANLKTQAQASLSASGDEETYLLLMGIFGVAALAATPYSPFEQMFHAAAVSSAGGSCGGGSGCGGSGCGGGGCGGGGCGGGGCGGCGGS